MADSLAKFQRLAAGGWKAEATQSGFWRLRNVGLWKRLASDNASSKFMNGCNGSVAVILPQTSRSAAFAQQLPFVSSADWRSLALS
jgi:hypothetical protein